MLQNRTESLVLGGEFGRIIPQGEQSLLQLSGFLLQIRVGCFQRLPDYDPAAWEKVKRERIALIKARRKAGFGTSRRGPTHFSEIVRIVKQNPQLGPKSIQRELSTSAYGFINLSVSTIYRRLRERGLNTKEKRIRFASLGGGTMTD